MNYPAASCGVSIKDSNPSLERSKLRGTNPKRELDRINRIDMIENQNSYLTPARRSSLEPQRAQRCRPQTHTDNCRLAQGVEVSQSERKQTCLLSFHSCLPSVPAASSAGSPLPGPLERLHKSPSHTVHTLQPLCIGCLVPRSLSDHTAKAADLH